MNNFIVYEHVNKVNGKRYIGITSYSLEERSGLNGQRYTKDHQEVFYNAIQKYGWNNFEHNIIAQNLSFDEAAQLEKELIKKYHTYIHDSLANGYNMTYGGEGHSKWDPEIIYELWLQGLQQTEITQVLGCCPSTIRNALKMFNINFDMRQSRARDKVKKKVDQYDLNNNYITTYNSVAEAAKQFNKESAATHIARVCRGERKSTLGYKWGYIE